VEACIVLSTFASAEDAARTARSLVERRLVACVNLVPGVRSIYRWQGEIEDGAEVMAIMKTRRDRVRELLAALPALHPYEVPEVLVLPVAAGAGSYLDWLAREASPVIGGGAERESGD
jgi:periplasmic divalent cation tolerance protein